MAVLFPLLMMLILPNASNSTQIAEGLHLLSVLMASGRQGAVYDLAGEIERYRAQYGQYPASLATLAATPGFEQTKGMVATPGIGYATTTVSDGVWTFNRILLAGIDPSITWTSFLALNTCGNGNFSAASDWCGTAKYGDWFKSEGRSFYMQEAANARIRLNRTLNKFVGQWNTTGSFPAGTLSAGGSATLTSLAGTTVTASNCSGTFNFSGIPLDCGDLFNTWGGPVTYNYIGPSNIALVANTPFNYASGGHQTVIAGMKY